MGEPRILILHKPFNRLDKNGKAYIHDFLKTLKFEGKIMLLASHNAPDLTMACDKVYEFKDKHLVQGEIA